jgi:hypothetical protein
MKALSELAAASRNAPAVWLALVEIAAEQQSKNFQVSRAELAKRSDVAVRGITTALNALEGAKWIKRGLMFAVQESGKKHQALKIELLNDAPCVRCATKAR